MLSLEIQTSPPRRKETSFWPSRTGTHTSCLTLSGILIEDGKEKEMSSSRLVELQEEKSDCCRQPRRLSQWQSFKSLAVKSFDQKKFPLQWQFLTGKYNQLLLILQPGLGFSILNILSSH